MIALVIQDLTLGTKDSPKNLNPKIKKILDEF